MHTNATKCGLWLTHVNVSKIFQTKVTVDQKYPHQWYLWSTMPRSNSPLTYIVQTRIKVCSDLQYPDQKPLINSVLNWPLIRGAQTNWFFSNNVKTQFTTEQTSPLREIIKTKRDIWSIVTRSKSNSINRVQAKGDTWSPLSGLDWQPINRVQTQVISEQRFPDQFDLWSRDYKPKWPFDQNCADQSEFWSTELRSKCHLINRFNSKSAVATPKWYQQCPDKSEI